MKHILSFTLFWLLACSVIAQPYGDSKFKQKFNKADALVFDGSYMEALPLLEEMYKFDTANANLNYLLGVSYMLGKKDYSLAIKRLESSTKDVSLDYNEASWKERKAPGITYYYLGKAYHFKNQFDRAVTNYYNYRSFIEMDDVATYNQVRQQIQYAENAMELTKNPVGVKITNLGSGINTKYPDYCPVVSADGKMLIFTSRREGGTGGAKDQDGNFYDDIYVCHRQENGAWGKPKSIGSNINTGGHEAAIGLSPNGQLLFIYKDDNGDGNIYYSEKKGNDWTKPQPMGSDINTTSWETHASINGTEDMLVFVSNRSEGGYGGRDLWYCKRLPNGDWGLAQNMGSVINSQYEEDSPFISADGKTLIFSSQGHTSMGGFDIFRSEYVDGAWTVPENIGYPISSSEDDVFFVLTPDGRHAYYSSRKDGGFGDADIYKLRLEVKKSSGSAVARGIMKVPAMQYANINAKIIVTDEGGAQVGTYLPNKNSGYYVLILAPGETYDITYQADGYDPLVAKVSVADDEAYEEFDGVLELEEVVFGANILALQKETKRLEAEKEAAAAKAAEDERLAQEASVKAKEEAQQLALNQEKEAEVKKAEVLAQAEKEGAAKELAAEQEKTRLAEVSRKKAEGKARFEAEQALATEKKNREEEQARIENELAAKAIAEEEARKTAEENRLAAENTALAEAEKLALQREEEKKKTAAHLAEEQKLEEEFRAAELVAAQKLEKEAKAAEMQAAKKVAAESERKQAKQVAAAKEVEVAKLATEKKAKEEQKLAAQKVAELKKQEQAEEQQQFLAAEKAAEELERKQAERAAAEEIEAAALAAKKANEEGELIAEAKKAEQALAEKKAEEENTLRIAEGEKRRLELQEKIESLRQQQSEQEATKPEVKEVSIKAVDGQVQQTVGVDAEAIKAKRKAMLQRIEELKKQRSAVDTKKNNDEIVVAKATEKVAKVVTAKEELESDAVAKKVEVAELEEELGVIEKKVEEAKVKVNQAVAEKAIALETLEADKAEQERLAQEEKIKAAEALEAERQIKELEEEERKRIESERLAAQQFEARQQEEAERTQRELIQMEALAEQQRQVDAALEAEELKKANIDAAEKSAFTDEERNANATTLEQLREINKKLIADNLELKKQLAQLNYKLDLILARMDYQPDMEKVEIPDNSTMKNLQEGKRLILRNIYFDYNLASLRSKSKYELNKLFNFMKENADVDIVVSGHTDSRGNDEYNLRLSKDRAQAVVDYLIRNGISSSRLRAKGYGETRPIARNENSDLTDNAVGRQLNRRIEISMPKGREKGVEVEQVEIPSDARIK